MDKSFRSVFKTTSFLIGVFIVCLGIVAMAPYWHDELTESLSGKSDYNYEISKNTDIMEAEIAKVKRPRKDRVRLQLMFERNRLIEEQNELLKKIATGLERMG